MGSDEEVTRMPVDPEHQGLSESKSVDQSHQKDAPPPFPGHAGGIMENEDGELIDFKTLHWLQGGIVLVAETVSLGILSLPSVLATVGLVPGVILICTVSALATYSGLLLADFRKQYPFVQNFGDAVELIGKPIGMGSIFREVFGWAQTILQVFLIGGHILMWTICMNTLTDAVFITVIAVAIEKPIGNGSIDIFKSLGFSPAFLAVTNIAGAFSSHSIFFSVIAEFKNPDDWPKALAFLQITDTTLYIIAAVIIYVYVGPDVPSPALSAAGSATVRKAIWGVAIPTIAIAAVIYAHVASQYVFTRIFGNTKHVVRRTRLSTISWLLITLGIWGLGMVISESIPVFNNLLGLVSAAFASWFSFGLPGIFWLWMHHGNWFANWKQTCRFVATSLLLVVGIVLCVLGLWVSIESIANGGSGSKPWTCASNAAE
ncbi:hypothetical protein ACHAQA_003554 [Verticillium albo-atrum]